MNQVTDNINSVEQIGNMNETLLEFSINAKLFKNVINIISCLVDEVELRYNETGISFIVVDPAHVSMQDIQIPIKAFGTYVYNETPTEYNIKIGLNIDQIKNILKSVKKDDILNMSFTEDIINISVGNVETSIKNVKSDYWADPKIPNLNLTGHFILTSSEIYEAVRQCGLISDHIRISLDNENITFAAITEEIGNTKIKFSNDRIYERVESLYPEDYLKHFFKALKTADKKVYAKCDMGQDYPIRVNCTLDNDIRLTMLLAPRIEED